MPNKNYVKGRKKEYRICKELREAGYNITQRSAGSHSQIDIFAIDRSRKIIRFIQCKPEDYNADKIVKELDWLNGRYTVIFDVI